MNIKYKKTEFKPKGCSLLSLLLISLLFSAGCKKFLDEKSKLSLIVPQTPQDLERLLLNSVNLTGASASGYGEFVSDNIYVDDLTLNQFSSGNNINFSGQVQNYIWEASATGRNEFWSPTYTTPIYYSNIVLDQLNLINYESKDSALVNTLRGSALFIRAFHFYTLAQVFCRPYASEYFTFPGIVLRLTSDASIIDRKRATVKETYDKIIADLKTAAELLPVTTSLAIRPSQAAVYAALARVYLSMMDYANATIYVNKALSQRSALLDYNTRMPVNINQPFASFHTEVIYDDVSAGMNLVNAGTVSIDTLLFKSYDNNDLRKVLYFKIMANGNYTWNGSYNSYLRGNFPGNLFDGLATDELFLIRAECSARAGNKDSAMNDLNRLLLTRWKTGTYINMSAIDAADALSKVLIERRKELIYRGQRWTDIRRFNLEGANLTLRRNWNGTIYTLPPNDNRTVMPIPDLEINASGIEQNPR
jgi:starch-binding outer membrane protein, SusD/RagB family